MTKERLSKLEERIFLSRFFVKEDLERCSRRFKRKHTKGYLYQKNYINLFDFEDHLGIIKFMAFLLGKDNDELFIKNTYKVLSRLRKIGFIKEENLEITETGKAYLRRKKISYKALREKI